MVNYQPDRLDGIFAALSDPTRRAVLARLGGAEEVTVTALADPFAMSLPAVLKHLDVLENAGLIRRRKSGRTVSCRLNAAPMQEAQRWLATYERFWSTRLDALEQFLTRQPTPNTEPTPWPPNPPPEPSPASPSSASSRRRPPGASAPGPTRKS
jgi:DNA-binding transcriptional ArsR family regulator